ncbi:MAG TPA: PQQ-binding-like beta-propeller repeat protein [Candidatus Acidoferrum sp.]|nr:PQQ-binding-like beta-propeller repeat protein [Candidatus Acidoferrum sp.]
MRFTKVFFLSAALLVICLGGLFACRRSGQASSESASGPRILWSYNSGSDLVSGIALAPNGTVHFASEKSVYSLSPEGKLLWKAPLPSGPVVAAPTLSPTGTLYAASQSGKLFALDPSGNLIWQSGATTHKFFTPPALGTGDALYVTDDFTDIFAFSPSFGPNLTWKQMTFSPTGSRDDILLGTNTGPYGYGPGEWRSSPIIAADDMIYLAHQQWLYRLNQHGDVLWFVQLSSSPLGFPAIGADGMVYVEGHAPPFLFAIGPEGKQHWAARINNRLLGSPVVDNTGVIYLCDSSTVKALLPDSQTKWYVQADCNSGPALAADGTIYLGMNSREPGRSPHATSLAAIAPGGQLKWKIEINGIVRDAPAISPDGTIFFTTDQGYAYAISDAGSPPMNSPWPRFQHDSQNSGHSHLP